MAPHREDFIRWLEDPVTRFVMAAHKAVADHNKEEWVRTSWDNGVAAPEVLRELRVRADAYMAIVEIAYEDICNALGEQPNEE